MKQKNIYIAILLLLMITVSGCSLIKSSKPVSIDDIEKTQSIESKIAKQYQPDRSTYGTAVYSRAVAEDKVSLSSIAPVITILLALIGAIGIVISLVVKHKDNEEFIKVFNTMIKRKKLSMWLTIISAIFITASLAMVFYKVPLQAGDTYEIAEVFKELPPLPADFYRTKYMVMTGKATSEYMCNISKEYYTQPEFYSDSFETLALQLLRNPRPEYWTPEGYGTFPHEMESITQAGNKFSLCTFFHSSWNKKMYIS
jgi:hypothetical protein